MSVIIDMSYSLFLAYCQMNEGPWPFIWLLHSPYSHICLSFLQTHFNWYQSHCKFHCWLSEVLSLVLVIVLIINIFIWHNWYICLYYWLKTSLMAFVLKSERFFIFCIWIQCYYLKKQNKEKLKHTHFHLVKCVCVFHREKNKRNVTREYL